MKDQFEHKQRQVWQYWLNYFLEQRNSHSRNTHVTKRGAGIYNCLTQTRNKYNSRPTIRRVAITACVL